MRAYCLLLSLPLAMSAQSSVEVRVGSVTRAIPLERYVAGVLAGESSVFQSDEALEAMAVAARTYAVRMRGRHRSEGFDFCATTHCQRLDLDRITPRLEAIAAETAGELLWFAGKPAFTPYTRDCGGRTEDAAAVWPDLAAPYLKSRDDPHSISAWEWRADPLRVADALRRSQLRTPRAVDRISIAQRTPSGRARTLTLFGGGQSVRISAGSFRFAMGRELGWNTLLSDRYRILDGSLFEGQGSGHGVGLCQRGADLMGRAGRTCKEILAFYYPGAIPGLTAQGLTWHRLEGEGIALFSTIPDTDRVVLAAAQREARFISSRVGLSLPRDLEIRVYPGVETFRNATGEPGWVAAYTIGRRIHLQPTRVLAARDVLPSTLRHELLHASIEAHASPGVPLWFREGLVEYLAGTHAANGPIPTDSDLRQTHDEARARRAYADAAGAVAALVKRYGETVALDWLRTGLPAEVTKASNRQDPTKSR